MAENVRDEPTAYVWRELGPDDLPAVTMLELACRQSGAVDPAVTIAGYVESHGADGGSNLETTCAFSSGSMVAFACLAGRSIDDRECSLMTMGMVHPRHRRRGLGASLILWAERRAHELATNRAPGRSVTLQIDNEAASEEAAALYSKHGFEMIFAEEAMRRDLADPVCESTTPENISFLPWRDSLAGKFFEAYCEAFRDRPGFPGWSEAKWLEWMTDDADFRPDLSYLATAQDEIAGFVVCHSGGTGDSRPGMGSGWLTQVGVSPRWRHRGLATALVTMVLDRHRQEGFDSVSLHVNINNPGALRLYQNLGFQIAGRRARYRKTI